MTTAQLQTYGSVQKKISVSNDDVYRAMRKMQPDVAEPMATVEQVIHYMVGDRLMTAVEGKRLSQPVYRALSEGADAGIVDDTESVINPDTKQPNTLYRLLKVPGPAKTKDLTWKQRALAAEAKLRELEGQYRICCNTVDKQEAKIASLNEQVLSLGTAKA